MIKKPKKRKTCNWSETHYSGLTQQQHHINNIWFIGMMGSLNEGGVLYVPELDKSFLKNEGWGYYNNLD